MQAAERAEVIKMGKYTNETRVALLEQSISYIYESLQRMDTRFDRLEEKIEQGFRQINERFEIIDGRFENVHSRIDSNNKWLIGTAVSAFLGFLAIAVNIALRFYFRS